MSGTQPSGIPGADGRHTETARAVPGEVTQGRARRPRPADCRSAEMTRHGTGAAVRRELVDPTSSWTSSGAHGGPGVTRVASMGPESR